MQSFSRLRELIGDEEEYVIRKPTDGEDNHNNGKHLDHSLKEHNRKMSIVDFYRTQVRS